MARRTRSRRTGASVEVYKQDRRLIDKIKRAIEQQTGKKVSEKKLMRWIIRKALQNSSSVI